MTDTIISKVSHLVNTFAKLFEKLQINRTYFFKILLDKIIIYNVFMATFRDNLHYNFRKIDGYNKPINIVISAREGAKSTSFVLDKSYLPWKKNGQITLYLVRNVVEITEALIQSIENIINKFTDDNVRFLFSKASMRDGIVDIKIKDKLFMRIIALNISVRRIKQSLTNNVGVIGFDEFIINPRQNEKYLKGEANKIAEIYTTYKREKADKEKPLKMYFLGNPYSLYNPIFMWLGISPSKLHLGQFLVGEDYVVEWYDLLPELRAKILAENPLYKFDEDYKTYAFEGKPVNDTNIKVAPFPKNYHLQFVFKIENRFIGVFQNNYWEDHADLYYCKFMTREEISSRRVQYCFDFGEMIDGTSLFSNDDRNKFNRFRIAMRKRLVAFASIDCYYLIEEIYFNL